MSIPSMIIAEIFRSIQGESTLAGTPTLFVRCVGCNLDCVWCDTPYARSGGTATGIAAIIAEAEASGVKAVCITGGEPLLQLDTPDLARALLDRGFIVSVETNGSLPVTPLPLEAIAVIDVKCPGSGQAGSFHPSNIGNPRNADEYKFVLTGRGDFDFACDFVRRHDLAATNTVLFSPIPSSLAPVTLAGWIVDEFPAARLNLQLHRLIWPDDNRGR